MINSKDIFENPFEDINANVLEPRQIVEYWCSPFQQGLLNDFDEFKFRTCKVPIILQGSRGSGKTTILKYFSYPAQLERAEKQNRNFLEVISDEMEVGFYYRCDDSFISTFKSIFRKVSDEGWTKIFDSYLELLFCKNMLELYFVLLNKKEINCNHESEMVKKIINDTPLKDFNNINTLRELYNYVCNQVNYISNYKNRSAFIDEEFQPDFMLDLFNISSRIVVQLKENYLQFNGVLFVFMFDEFENLSIELQKRFNSLIKFARDDISIRVGRRSEGVITNETINDVEYLRENNDYYLASLDRELDKKDNKKVREYFLGIAEKRFDIMKQKNGTDFDIINMLGDRENLDIECKEVCKKRKQHLYYILKENPNLAKDEELCNKIVEIIRNDDNPIAETINALWVIRKREDSLETAKQVSETMKSFFGDKTNGAVKKYADDYNNKYRYAITAFLCTVYKKDKLYYGFNSISYLSNGNPRTFINICRTIISDACFFEKKNFYETGKISKETQSRAIHNFAKAEFDEICSIIKYGKNIRTFILNLGNIFSNYHKDRKIRYPETNQFVFDEMSLYADDKEIIKTALSWSMIIKKEKAQRLSASVNRKGDIYHINKVFYPIFNISYRTRGGVNPQFDCEQIHSMLYDFYDSDNQSEKRKKNKEASGQISIFDMEGFKDE